jgi:hypothetical protein
MPSPHEAGVQFNRQPSVSIWLPSSQPSKSSAPSSRSRRKIPSPQVAAAQAVVQPSSSAALPSSQPSKPSSPLLRSVRVTASPQAATVQLLVQASEGSVLPSSQDSPVSTCPLPQAASVSRTTTCSPQDMLIKMAKAESWRRQVVLIGRTIDSSSKAASLAETGFLNKRAVLCPMRAKISHKRPPCSAAWAAAPQSSSMVAWVSDL